MNDHENAGRGSAGAMIGITALVVLVAFGLLWSIAGRKSAGEAAGLNQMFADIQQSADAAAAASSPIQLDTSSACVVDERGRIVRFHIVVRNEDTLAGATVARPVLQLANGDAISRDEDDQQLQIPAGTSSTVDVGIPYEEEKPASCAVTLSIGGGGSVALSSATA